MDIKNWIGVVIGILVGGLILSCFVPVIVSTQQTVGDGITLTNESYEYVSLSNGDVNTTYEDGVLKINDVTQTVPAVGGQIFFACDYVILWFNGSVPYGSYLNQASGIRNIASFDLTVSDNKLSGSVTYDNNKTQTVSDQDITFSFYYDPNGEYSVFKGSTTQPYVNSDVDITAVGTYYTGDNKTFYWCYNGVAGGIDENFTYGATISKTLTDGTTDIYNVTGVTFDISGETFTPFYMIAPKEVSGHQTSGAMYDILGMLPLVAGVGLLMFAVVYFLRRY